MTLPAWHEEPIAKSHRRQEFDCGDADMNRFLHRYARQSHEQNAAKTFCAIDDALPGRILGFYTITPSAVAHDQVPPSMTRGLARHEVAGFKLARIATDITVAGQGLGGQLLATAALRCLRTASEVGGVLLIIDAKGEQAASWYASYGAEPLKDHPLMLVMPLATYAEDLRAKGLLQVCLHTRAQRPDVRIIGVVPTGAAATAALMSGKVGAPAGSRTVSLISGGNIDLNKLAGLLTA